MVELYAIYKHTCTTSGKSYIGQTKNLSKRTEEHKRPSSSCLALRNAIRQHGWESFTTEVLCENLTLDQANTLEEQLIISHQTLYPCGYNLKHGGNNRSPSNEVRAKISAAKKGIPRSEAAKTAMRGKRGPLPSAQKPRGPQTPEHVEKRISRIRGRKHSADTIAKMRKPKGQRPIVVCPHCSKSGADSLMHRWHFMNCAVR